MTYGQLKKQVMQLVFSESIAGNEIPPSYNNQADYLRMIPGRANDGMMYIATTVKRIPELIPLTSLSYEEMPNGDRLYTLPEDFWRMHNGGLVWPKLIDWHTTVYERFHWYRIYANNKLLIPRRATNQDEMLVEYYRYPHQLPDEPEDDEELDNTPDTQSALPYYVAAQLVLYDDPFRYSALYNEFETRLSRITEPVTTEYSYMEDSYGGFNVPGV